MMKNIGKLDYLYLLTILFFGLGFFNILFAWLGFICMVTPFILVLKDRKKTWCQHYCPRAQFYTTLFKRKKGKPAPKWLRKSWVKEAFLIYFSANLFILFMSTIMVFLGRIQSMEMVRFMIAFELPWNMPQLINVTYLPSWMVHLSFRIYSMMFTTTILGLILGFIYKPRTWCIVCPINTLSNLTLDKLKEKDV